MGEIDVFLVFRLLELDGSSRALIESDTRSSAAFIKELFTSYFFVQILRTSFDFQHVCVNEMYKSVDTLAILQRMH